MQQIFPGLYVITRMATNCYLLESAADQLTLIDTGMPGTTRQILKAMEALNYRPEQLKQILITHADLDHAGSLAKLVEATGAEVYAGVESVEYLEAGKAPPHIPRMMASFMNTFQKPAQVDHAVEDHSTLDIAGGILAIHVPGHTPDNYNFYWRKEGVLFAADLFFTLTRNLSLSPAAISWDRGAVQRSAVTALDLAPRYICPGHGQPVNLAQSPQIGARLRRKLEGGVTLAAT